MPEQSNGGRTTGEELQAFFLGLLADGEAMRRYQTTEERSGVIGDVLPGDSDAAAEARRLLQEGTLREIEEQIRTVRNSPAAMPTVIVWPPM